MAKDHVPVNEMEKKNMSFDLILFFIFCVCLPGMADHCSGPHQSGHLLWHAYEQGSAWWIPQEKKAEIVCNDCLKENGAQDIQSVSSVLFHQCNLEMTA